MKKAIVKGFVTAGLLVMLTMIVGVSTQAQSLQYRLTANIPFDFTVADKKLPAGKYWVRRAQETSGDMVLQVRSVEGNAIVSRVSIPVSTINPRKNAVLVFHRYGDSYFLSEVWPAGGATGRAFPKLQTERELEKKARENVVGAVNAPKAEVVTVVATMN